MVNKGAKAQAGFVFAEDSTFYAGLRNSIRTHGLLENNESTVIRPGTIRTGTELLCLLIETRMGTHGGFRELFPKDFTSTISTRIVVLKL